MGYSRRRNSLKQFLERIIQDKYKTLPQEVKDDLIPLHMCLKNITEINESLFSLSNHSENVPDIHGLVGYFGFTLLFNEDVPPDYVRIYDSVSKPMMFFEELSVTSFLQSLLLVTKYEEQRPRQIFQLPGFDGF